MTDLNEGVEGASRTPSVDAVFVWGCYAALVAAALAYVCWYCSSIPFLDEISFVQVVTGKVPLTGKWLWAQQNEHRNPLPRLIFLGAYTATSCDARAMAIANVVCLAGLAGLLLLELRRLRGRTHWTDAVVPFALLQLGHYGAFLWGMTFTYVFATALGGILLVVMTRAGPRPSRRAIILVGLLLLAMVMSGANGLVFVPATALWLVYVWVAQRRAGNHTGRVVAAVLTLVLAVCGLYFVGYSKPAFTATGLVDESTSSTAALKTTLAFLAASLGPAGRTFWPYSGLVVGAVLFATLAALAVRFLLDRSGRRPALAGVFCYLLAFATLAAAVGWGRRGYGTGWVLNYIYYSTMAAPLLFGTHVAWQVMAWGELTRLAQVVLFTLVTTTLLANAAEADRAGRSTRAARLAVESDVRAGLPVSQVTSRHARVIHFFHEVTHDTLDTMRRHRVGVFEQLREDPPFYRHPIQITPVRVHGGRWEGNTARTTDGDSHLVFALQKRGYVRGVTVRFRHKNAAEIRPFLKFYWRDATQEDFTEARSYTHFQLPTAPDSAELTVWVYSPVDEIKIHPDTQACEMVIESITVITAEGDLVP